MSFYTKIVGVTYDNQDGTSRQDIIAGLSENSPIKLARDYANLYDPNAILVVSDKGQLGFISKERAGQIAARMDAEETINARISRLTGGGDYTRGVNIEVFGY